MDWIDWLLIVLTVAIALGTLAAFLEILVQF
jgi:hypothetical protein